MRLEFHTLDVFTAHRFGGNPLAVVMGADDLAQEQMQLVAREFNLSETIFVMKPADPANSARVRIFLPAAEIPFAGHPTIGCAILLAELRHKPGCVFETTIRLEEAVGVVPVSVTRIGDRPSALLTVPTVPAALGRAAPESKLVAQAVGLEESEIGFGEHRTGLWQAGPSFVHVPLVSLEALARSRVIEPYWSQMTHGAGVIGAYLYAAGGSNPETGYRTRMYAPAFGIPEDPATGAAAAMLAAQLLASNAIGTGQTRIRLEQGYEMGRPSEITLETEVAGGMLKAVRVGGEAVRMTTGWLEL